MSAVHDDYEQALWSNSFYSSHGELSQLSLSNHLHSLQRTVKIPHLVLTNLVRAGLLDDSAPPATNRTLLMRISPSMKALESVLNEKSSKPQPDAIQEEAEPLDANMASVQTFHTARSSETLEQLHRRSSSSTIGDTGYSAESTPRLNQPAAFYTVKHTSKDFSPQLKTVGGTFPKEMDSADTKVGPELEDESVGKNGDIRKEKEESGKEENSKERKIEENGKQSKSMLLNTAVQDIHRPHSRGTEPVRDSNTEDNHAGISGDVPLSGDSVQISKSMHELPAVPSTATDQTDSSALKTTQKGKVLSTGLTMPKLRSMLEPVLLSESPKLEEPFQPTRRKPTKQDNNTKGTKGKETRASPLATPRTQITRMSPLKRTKSATPEAMLTRTPNQANDGEKTPNGAKNEQNTTPGGSRSGTTPRSSTMGDLAGASKRFSFRGFFKLKSRTHSLDKVVETNAPPSVPAKLSSKSYSTPNFGDFRREKARKSIFGKKKRDVDIPEEHAPEPFVRRDHTPQTPTTATTDAPETPQTAEINTHTIREVDDLDYMPAFSSEESLAKGGDTWSGDAWRSPAMGSSALGRGPDGPAELYGTGYTQPGEVREELTLEAPETASGRADQANFPPEPLRVPTADLFGLPFAVTYSPTRSPRIVLPSQRASFKERKNDQLLGETLFPKSLAPREVESIVSLERSRSMRSLRSNGKRSSYINYAGSDENVVLGETLSRSGSVHRSGSILKGSALVPVLLDAAMEKEREREEREGKENENDEENGKTQLGDMENGDVLGDVEIDAVEISEGQMVTGETKTEAGELQAGAGETHSETDLGTQLETGETHSETNLERQPETAVQMQLVPDTLAHPQLSSVSAPSTPVFQQQNIQDQYSPPEAGIHDFIEFSNFIDADLDFSLSPRETLESSLPSVVGRTTGLSSELAVAGPASPELANTGAVSPEFLISSPTSPELPESSIRPESLYVPNSIAESVPEYAEPALETDLPEVGSEARPHYILSESPVSASENSSAIPTHIYVESASPEPVPEKSPILKAAYKIATHPLRPVLMSFRGFSGSKLANVHSDTLVNLEDSVGQGFGSDSDSDSENESFDAPEERAFSEKSTPPTLPALKQNGSMANRLSTRNSLGLQPPTFAGPFHHDRIPSLSDHSAASSPRSLTSLISRIKRSPMASPKVTKAGVRFSSRIVLYDTYNGDEYDRHPDIATCNQLTPQLAQQIKDELNEFKSVMRIHRDSHCYTHFF